MLAVLYFRVFFYYYFHDKINLKPSFSIERWEFQLHYSCTLLGGKVINKKARHEKCHLLNRKDSNFLRTQWVMCPFVTLYINESCVQVTKETRSWYTDLLLILQDPGIRTQTLICLPVVPSLQPCPGDSQAASFSCGDSIFPEAFAAAPGTHGVAL